ncbi:MAG: ethylbenzene dehydrogenase-related protein [Microthrixaceae bacterium]|nr:ethylbenzene dehydrogenase-related protein [Microthrixaceae bacterium]
MVANEVDVPLTAQQVSYPMGGGSIPSVKVRALQADGTLYMRIQWADETADDRGSQVDEYTDAVAVEFPSVAGSSVPAICMGQADGGVNIWQWRATNQDQLGESANDLFPDAQVDMYPSTDDLFFTAREAGNPVAVSGAGSTENLVAKGFGTLTDTKLGQVQGRGSWSDGMWTVVVARDLTVEGEEQIEFTDGSPIDTAFAVWNGAEKERNGKKSVSAFIQLTLDPEIVKFNPGASVTAILVFSAVALGFGAVLVWIMTRRSVPTPAMAGPDGTSGAGASPPEDAVAPEDTADPGTSPPEDTP